jgi:3,4-dihydroxy 2-butanone 4-phosphate synthase/GTP cyclohydrolase II
MGKMFVGAEEAIEQIAEGRMVVVTDAEDRENEGDLVVAAQFATAEVVNFMARHGRGLICLALDEVRCEQLELGLQMPRGESAFDTAFTVSIEARHGVTTGISAHDRARTIQVAVDPDSTAADLVRPGHVFPLRARPGGVLERAGHTEAAVELAWLAGLQPAAGVICEILNEDGTMARVPDLELFCRRHGLSMVTIDELVAHRQRTEPLIERVAAARLPTKYGEFRIIGYRELPRGEEHVVLLKGDVAGHDGVLTRLHSQCLTGDAFGSSRCDCGGQLEDAMRSIAECGRGVLVHLAQEGRGIGLLNKIRAYELQDRHGLDTLDANLALGEPVDQREFGVGAWILRDLGVRSVRLMTNNPHKAAALEAHGLPVSERLALERRPTQENLGYLRTKRDRMGHRLTRVRHLEVAGEPHVEPQRFERRPACSDDHSWMPGVEMAV